jgi:hypothetical protein
MVHITSFLGFFNAKLSLFKELGCGLDPETMTVKNRIGRWQVKERRASCIHACNFALLLVALPHPAIAELQRHIEQRMLCDLMICRAIPTTMSVYSLLLSNFAAYEDHILVTDMI